MASPYQIIITELRHILMPHGIKYEKFENDCIINIEKKALTNKWEELKIEKIKTLVKNKYKELSHELDRVKNSLCAKLENLDTLNELLIKLKIQIQPSITKVKKELKKIYINIFDLEAGLYHKQFSDKKSFQKYTKKYKLFYPLEEAKNNLQFKYILQNL